ncbi:threonine ammonia-lyase, partial [bacterium]|nr:threonine ammonia-lyase [bacterium]
MITLQTIEKAAAIMSGRIIKTPLLYSPNISRLVNAEVYLKLENLQKTGSFKIRGATHKLLVRKSEIGANGVVTASAGNHAQGVALAATLANIPATIVMPEWASISKQEATAGYGGRVIIFGASVEESLKKAQAMTLNQKTFIHPFDDPDIIQGQGTIALEIFEDLPDTDLIISPIGGGGLISGIAIATRAIRPTTKIIGVQAASCPSAYLSIKAGKITKVKARRSIADGISVKQTGSMTFDLIKQYVDDILLVEEGNIAQAILMLLERKKVLAEGAGAVSLAAILSNQIRIVPKSKVVLIISGGNVDSPLLDRIINQGLVQ